MGYRERQAHRNQQKQQSLGQSYSPEQLVTLPAPVTMNSRDNPLEMPDNHCPIMVNAFPTEGGTELYYAPQRFPAPILASGSAYGGGFGPFISYYGSGSTSAEFWAIAGKPHRLTNAINSIAGTASSEGNTVSQYGAWTQFGRTVIYVAGTGTGQYWTRASGWNEWNDTVVSVSASLSASNFVDITSFKNRLFAYPAESDTFYYGSTDQVFTTFQPFSLTGIVQGSLRQMFSLSRDGGDGPDDYMAFVSENGDVAVYAGTDPSDATDWSLVGVYKIGRPVARDAHITWGNQVIVMCDDDFYFLPRDMAQERQASVAAARREPDRFQGYTNAVYDRTVKKIVWSDGTVFDPHRGYAYSMVQLTSADPAKHRRWESGVVYSNAGGEARPMLGEFKGKAYVAQNLLQHGQGDENANEGARVRAIFDGVAGTVGQFGSKVITKPLPTSGRTNISLVAPQIASQHFLSSPAWTVASTATASLEFVVAPLNIRYRTGVAWDNFNRPYLTASASNTIFTSAVILSADGVNNTFDKWASGAGTGHYAQLFIDTQATGENPNNRNILYGFKITVSDTGGI